MNNYILLSHILRVDTPSYGNRDRVEIRANSSIDKGDTANTSSLFLCNNHIGTHIDVPRHFALNGKRSYDYPIGEYVFNNVSLVDIPRDSACLIGPKELEGLVIDQKVELLLIRTGFEKKRAQNEYWNNNPGLAPELANYLRSKYPYLRCVGFDFISVTSWQYRPEGRLSHREFLAPSDGKQEIWCVEDMSLKEAPEHISSVIIAPLFVQGGNGGPVTVVAVY